MSIERTKSKQKVKEPQTKITWKEIKRHSIRFLMMLRSLADRAALKSMYVRFMRQQVQALW